MVTLLMAFAMQPLSRCMDVTPQLSIPKVTARSRNLHTRLVLSVANRREVLMNERFASRRRFLKTTAATAVGAALPVWSFAKGAPAIVAADSERPLALQGLSLGDPSDGSIVVWSRSDRPARMLLDWSYDE